MRRHLFDLVVLAVGSTVVLGYIVAAQPGWRDVALHVWIVIVGALLLGGLVTATGATTPGRRSPLDRVLADRSRAAARPAEVARLEREVTLGAGAAYDLHYRLLPTLREIAWARLERSGRIPGPDTLGRWWDLMRPDREPPSDRFAPGIGERDLRALVDDLEKM